MGRRPCCLKEGVNRGAWTAMEDKTLTQYIAVHGEGKWRDVPQRAGLRRCGKSCRLRWLNYLRPTIKRGNITPDEEDLIIRLHSLLGNRWALIAGRLPGRTDNEIKNYWNTKITKTIKLAQPASNTPPPPNPLPWYISDDQPQHVLAHSSSSSFDDDDEQYNTKAKPSVVIRTKATRCTKAVTVPSWPPQPQDHIVTEPPAKSSLKSSVGPESLPSPSMILEQEDDMSNFLIDFEMDEHFLSDFFNEDFMNSIALQPSSCLELSACAGTSTTSDDASPKSDHENPPVS
ncbi:hypothetical protein FNV43_RR08130 [Rhamnella rubrinervis]|uniref:Uncharacterized protein n=1 Tax=Rhamnella rubrinervis TaxID=2594499 RepID=A0A8K0HH25_9ROSA|nr:hypothetical protein FNV43_RR08130 [Rhamnella rubrinervis]